MSNEFLDAKPQRGARAAIIGLTVVAVAAITALLVVVIGHGAPSPTAAVPPQTEPSTAWHATPVPSTGPMTLVQGSILLNGLYVGFPHTTVGAVSAATEYWTELGSTLDPDRAAAIGRAVADPSWTNAASELAQGPANSRKSLDLPTQGAVPPEASMQLTVEEYQLLPSSASNAEVLLLGYMSTTTADGTQSRVGVYPMQLHWTDDDWKLRQPTDTSDYANLVAIPGTPNAAGLGWQPINH